MAVIVSAMPGSKRNVNLSFTCPRCGHSNPHPREDVTAGGTEIVICDECGLGVSRRVVSDALVEREKSIMRWAGWDEQ